MYIPNFEFQMQLLIFSAAAKIHVGTWIPHYHNGTLKVHFVKSKILNSYILPIDTSSALVIR